MSPDTPEPAEQTTDNAPAPKKATRKVAKKATKKVAKKATKKTAKKVVTKVAEDTTATKKDQLNLFAEEGKTEESPKKRPSRKPARAPKEKNAEGGNDSEGTTSDAPSDNENRHEGRRSKRPHNKKRPDRKKKEIVLTGDPIEVNGLLELANKGFGFLRVPLKGFTQARDDVFVPPDHIREHGLRNCVWIHGIARSGPKGLQLTEIHKINGDPVADREPAPIFEDLKATNPDKRISFETKDDCFNTRILDLVAPVGRGQRGLIVAPPRSGKTTLLMDIAKAAINRHEDEIYPIFLLIDERPEEVTEFKRALPDIEMFASSNDSGNRNHMRIAELCIERAKRLTEEGKHVLILMDSLTRLARAYNRGADSGGGGKGGKGGKNKGYQSGGIVSGSLEIPRRLFAAARNTREAGSLTILATTLVQTNSKADEAIFQEFKGTGNMEIVLDRRLADHYIYPAVDIFKSGTRREELLLPEITLKKFQLIRRGLKGQRPDQAMERLLFFLKKFPSNAQMLLEIKG